MLRSPWHSPPPIFLEVSTTDCSTLLPAQTMFDFHQEVNLTLKMLSPKCEKLNDGSLSLHHFKEKHPSAHSGKIGMGGQETSNILCSLIFTFCSG